MGIIDIVLGALILFGLVRGFMKGLFVEVASLVALIAGVYGAIHFSNFAGDFLESKVDWNENTINIVAFAITLCNNRFNYCICGESANQISKFCCSWYFK